MYILKHVKCSIKSLIKNLIDTGRTSRAGEGVESRDRLGDERTEGAQTCSGTEWYCVEKRVGCGGIEYSDEICYRLVREIVTFSDSGINS